MSKINVVQAMYQQKNSLSKILLQKNVCIPAYKYWKIHQIFFLINHSLVSNNNLYYKVSNNSVIIQEQCTCPLQQKKTGDLYICTYFTKYIYVYTTHTLYILFHCALTLSLSQCCNKQWTCSGCTSRVVYSQFYTHLKTFSTFPAIFFSLKPKEDWSITYLLCLLCKWHDFDYGSLSKQMPKSICMYACSTLHHSSTGCFIWWAE